MDVNPKGAIVVVASISSKPKQGSSTSSHSHASRACCYGQVVGKKGKSMVLPVRNEMEMTKIGRVGGLHVQKAAAACELEEHILEDFLGV